MTGPRALFWLASAAFFMQSLDTTMLYVAVPAIARALHQPVLRMEPIVMAYVITVVAFTPINSWLSQHLGERRTCLAALTIFTGGALLCFHADSALQLGLGRFIQGTGGALLLPVIRTQVLRYTPADTRLSFLNRMTLLGMFGTLTGPLLGSLLTDGLSWRAIFIAPVPLALLCLWLAWRILPTDTSTRVSTCRVSMRHLLPLVGILLTVTLLLAAAPRHLLSLPVIVLLGLVCTLCTLFYLRSDLPGREALLPVSLFSIRSFYVGVWGGVLTRLLLASLPVVISLVVQTSLGLPPATAGLIMLLFSLGALLAKLLFEPLIRWLGYRHVLMYGTLLASALVLLLGLAIQHRLLPVIGVCAVAIGLMTALLHSAESTLACCHLCSDTYNSGNNIMILSQLIAVMLSMALTFPALRLFSQWEPLLNINHFSLLLLLLGTGLPLSCLLFRHLSHEEGKTLLTP
ncbi:MFS transporter [Dickeya parazeae]|uniref:Major facilitator superfamily MFS_1 n=1 Tax=Dickeya zeae (strain Ech586) TaxID=590409 RepID=D2BT86_DICZ5|nr:MFS transporter [Dickeya parazeae]ACZ75723.1 major facilitator superfamily MFS_1 [Dickeya parazeae Ech586]MBP2834637.1 MFS transporter [Dickeya parazeae]